MKTLAVFLPNLLLGILLVVGGPEKKTNDSLVWETMSSEGTFQARHEAEYIECGGKFYLIGGRGWRALNIYDPKTNTWSTGKKPEKHFHHFQALSYKGEIWLGGAMVGNYPNETAHEHIMIYSPEKDEWREGPKIDRPRGAGGFVLHEGMMYLVCGITNGHVGGHVAWCDRLDPETGKWTRLADAPFPRDHFKAAVIDGKIWNAGGRRSQAHSKEGVFAHTVKEVDCYDVAGNSWRTLPKSGNIPTPRAGTMTAVLDGRLIVAGGESEKQKSAYNAVEILDPSEEQWSALPSMQRGRHGSGLISYEGCLYVASGSGNQGGAPELKNQERLVVSPIQ